jgi:hypothetical protein
MATMIAIEMLAAMRPYSMAVAPFSLLKKALRSFIRCLLTSFAGITRRYLSGGEALTLAFRGAKYFPEYRRPRGAFCLEFEAAGKKKGPGSAGAFLNSNGPSA